MDQSRGNRGRPRSESYRNRYEMNVGRCDVNVSSFTSSVGNIRCKGERASSNKPVANYKFLLPSGHF
jgi:hypothetical protein